MPRSRPTSRALAELHAGARRDLAAIFDAWPTMVDLSSCTGIAQPPGAKTDADLIRGKSGQPSDPTLNQALNITAAVQWRRDVARLLGALQSVAARAADVIGEVPEGHCPICRHALDDGRPTHTASGRKLHRACYDATRQPSSGLAR